MELNELKKYCLKKKGAVLEYPFGKDVPVIKVSTKMFALFGYDKDILRINLKCDPNYALGLRQKYSSIIPGYHMNKLHWNTILINGQVPKKEVLHLIDHSYELVVKTLKKAEQNTLIK